MSSLGLPGDTGASSSQRRCAAALIPLPDFRGGSKFRHLKRRENVLLRKRRNRALLNEVKRGAPLFGFGLLDYVQRTGVAIAAERMIPELGLTPVEFGWLLSAFLIGYTVFQLPGAIVGQRLGSHRTLTAIGLLIVLAASATALAPLGHASVLVFTLVLLSRFLLGVVQAALYPVESGALENWFPMRRWGVCQGVLVTGMWLGAAVTPPLVAWLMTHGGWRGGSSSMSWEPRGADGTATPLRPTLRLIKACPVEVRLRPPSDKFGAPPICPGSR